MLWSLTMERSRAAHYSSLKVVELSSRKAELFVSSCSMFPYTQRCFQFLLFSYCGCFFFFFCTLVLTSHCPTVLSRKVPVVVPWGELTFSLRENRESHPTVLLLKVCVFSAFLKAFKGLLGMMCFFWETS